MATGDVVLRVAYDLEPDEPYIAHAAVAMHWTAVEAFMTDLAVRLEQVGGRVLEYRIEAPSWTPRERAKS